MEQIQIQDGFLPRLVAFGGIIIVLLSMAFLVFLVISRRHRNRLVLRQRAMQEEFDRQLILVRLEVQENTFHQLGQELHDNIGQLLGSTKMLLGITERKLPETPDTLKTAGSTLSRAIIELRNLTKSLNTEWLHQFNLVDNLRVETERIRASREMQIGFGTNTQQLPLEPNQQVMAFRIMQEALQNAIRHSEATSLQLAVTLQKNNVELSLSDNGKGFNESERQNQGVGIMNMRHRVKLLDGNIQWTSTPGKGTHILVSLPIQNPQL